MTTAQAAAPTREAGHAPAARTPAATRAAVAEALHVGGRFAEAARAWAELAGSGHDVASSALKAAMSYLAAGDERTGQAWLERAGAAGAEVADVRYVTAQHALSLGRAAEAEAALREACRERGGGPELTALGVQRWRGGARAEARRLFSEALARDPGDPLARIDLVSADLQEGGAVDRAAAVAMLAEAAAAAPHRAEPFVLYSRLGVGRRERAEALARARLRTRQLTSYRPATAADGPLGDAHVSVRRATTGPHPLPERSDGSASATELCVTARFSCDADPPGGLPATVLVNGGYRAVTVGGRAAVPGVPGRAGAPGHPGAPAVRYGIPAGAWRYDAGRAVLEVRVEGTPRPPFARVAEGWLELGEGSAWVPVPGPGWRWRFTPDVEVGEGTTTACSRPGAGDEGFTLVALTGAERVGAPPVTALGRVARPLLRRAADVAARAGARWQEVLGRPVPEATVVVVDRPDSTFCYHRPGLTRVTSAVAADEAQHALLYHEVGHHWWGGAVDVAPEDRWLAEALAEYTLHLAEQTGDLRGYRVSTLAALRRLGGGRLPAAGLAALARTGGTEAAYVLRAKGAFVVGMLRALVGETAFRATLRACADGGHPLDAYTFFALASAHHGHAVDWFANQWVHAEAAMRLHVADAVVRRRRGAYHVSFVARCDGYAVPGSGVEFLVRGEGASALASANLDLAPATVSVRLPTRPRSITVDPALRWYADVPERVVNLEP